MAIEWYPTVSNVISDAAIGLGLASATITNPYASTDVAVLQLNQFLADVGMDLLREHDWAQLQATHTFPTVESTTNYDPPADFNRFLNQTQWNRTTTFPLAGPLGPGQWQQVQATGITSTTQYLMRFYQNKLFLSPTPGAMSNTIAFEYISRYWVGQTGTVTRAKEVPTVSTDILHFDRRLLVEGVKSRYRVEKGFAGADTYQAWLRTAKNNNNLAPVLNLNGYSPVRPRLLNEYNVRDTGYGS